MHLAHQKRTLLKPQWAVRYIQKNDQQLILQLGPLWRIQILSIMYRQSQMTREVYMTSHEQPVCLLAATVPFWNYFVGKNGTVFLKSETWLNNHKEHWPKIHLSSPTVTSVLIKKQLTYKYTLTNKVSFKGLWKLELITGLLFRRTFYLSKVHSLLMW